MAINLPAGMGLSFTETMRGFWTLDPALDAQTAFDRGQAEGRPIEFTLTIESRELGRFLNEPAHEADARGTVSAPALSPQPLAVTSGRFNLFIDDTQTVGVKLMRYQLQLKASDGRAFFFDGTKTIRDDRGLDVWPDTTTLVIALYEGGSATGRCIGRGVLHILVPDFAYQMTTMKVSGAPDPLTALRGLTAFGQFFAGTLWNVYGTVTAPLSAFDPLAPPRSRRALRAPAAEVHGFGTSDGVALRLTRYRGGGKGPVMLVHGLGVSSRIFSTDLIDTNLVEYLCANGFDVWLLDYRASIELPTSHAPSNGDQVARFDIPAAVDKIRAETQSQSVQVIAHCYGGTTFTMAMLAGLHGVRSAVISQVAAHVVAGPITDLKAGLHLPTVLNTLGVAALNAAASTSDAAFVQLLDGFLRFQEPRLGKRCTSRTCHRISFMYAPLYEHTQLNDATHQNLHELFGLANMKAFEHLAAIVRKGHVVDAHGAEAYLPNIAKLAAIPITIIHGANNECYLPASTERTLQALDQAAPGVPHRRHLIPGYGHIDCIFGKNAVADVYPKMLEHLEGIGK